MLNLTTNMGIENLIQIPTQEIAYTIANKPEPNLKVHPGQNIRCERDTLLNLCKLVRHDQRYKYIDRTTRFNIRINRLNKRYKRGGRRLQPDYRQRKRRPNMPNESNLVQIKCKSLDKKCNKNIRILTINKQSRINKDILLHNHLCDNDMDIYIASKTWLTDARQDETWIKMSTLENGGYNINIANRKERSGGPSLGYKKQI